METVRRVTIPAHIGTNIPENDILNFFENAQIIESAPSRTVLTFTTHNTKWNAIYCNGGDFISISTVNHAEPTETDIDDVTQSILNSQLSNSNVSVFADWESTSVRVLFRRVCQSPLPKVRGLCKSSPT